MSEAPTSAMPAPRTWAGARAGFRACGALALLAATLGILLEAHAQPGDAQSLATRVLSESPYSIHADEELDAFVQERARGAIEMHCARCHGGELQGRPGVPNLVDHDWLWGVTFEEANDVAPVMEIEQTILYGVRNTDCPDIEDISYYGACADTRFSQMPGYGELGVFDDEQLDDITEYVVGLSGRATDGDSAARGAALWPICIECHGPNGAGFKPYGGPNLTDDIWLFGEDRATIRDVIALGRTEACPAWGATLDLATIKSLAVYIWGQANGQYDDPTGDDLEDLFDFSR